MEITKTELKKAAKELNEQLGLEPPILLDLKVSALRTKVEEAAGLIDVKEDEFTDEVWEILEAMEVAARPGTVLESPEEEETEEEETEEEETEEEETEEEETAATVKEAVEETLVEDFKAAKKLAELKELAQEWDCFEKLDLDSYAGLQGPKKLRADMLECLPDEIREQVDPPPAVKTKVDKPAKEKKAKTPKGPGVIATIATAIENAGETGISKEDILKKLVAAFPDREADRMKKTINVQVPTRISKEKFKVGVKNDRYFKE